MLEGQDPRTAAAITAMSLDLAELLATIQKVRAQLQHVHAEMVCARLDDAERGLPLEPLQ